MREHVRVVRCRVGGDGWTVRAGREGMNPWDDRCGEDFFGPWNSFLYLDSWVM